ncbi:MAG TPA: DUF1579 family protein, partial [Tepidisphaeraceae bacterium]|nr:DUF1579 family protein [Tepidisphaeraceae bacterium]
STLISCSLCSISLFTGALIVHADDAPAPTTNPTTQPTEATQAEAPQAEPPPEATQPVEITQQDEWKNFSVPGPNHELLAKRVGTWTCISETFLQGEPVRNEGTVKRTMILGGRFLMEEMTTQFMGQEIQGLGICGFDNARKDYFYIWLDNMTTGLSYSFGKREGNLRNMNGTMSSPMGNLTFRTMTNLIDDDTDVFELYLSPEPYAPEQLVQRITYKRKS